jgi:hypothetical protein
VIGPVGDFSGLMEAAGVPGAHGAPMPSGLPGQATLNAWAVVTGEVVGLRFQEEEACGLCLVAEMPDGTHRDLDRVPRYILARPEDARAAVAAIVEAVVRDHGPGRVWSLAGHVHVVTEGLFARAVDIDGARHVVFRSWICHENGPRYDHARHPTLNMAQAARRERP